VLTPQGGGGEGPFGMAGGEGKQECPPHQIEGKPWLR